MSSLIAQYFLNHRLDAAELKWQVAEIARKGFHGIYAHARSGLLTPYQSEAWWQVLDCLVGACREHGLELWIWDEDYYPSGLCGGRVVWSDPGLVSRQLVFSVASVEETDTVEIDFAPGLLLRAFALPGHLGDKLGEPLDVTPLCGTRRQRWGERREVHRAYSPRIDALGHPHWRTAHVENRFALVWEPPEPLPYTICAALVQNSSGVHPDLLRPEGIRRFLELSYEPYAERYGDELGGVIKGAFTDEPSPGVDCYPWSADFPAEFHRDHGYDLLPHLAHLAVDIDDKSPLIRQHYRQTQHRLQRTNYLDQVADWCAEHDLKFVGHLTRTEWLSLTAAWWPNELRCYRSMDIPSCDPLGASEGWTETAAYHTGIKVASSAAHLFGKEQAGSDCLAVIGDEASIRDLKYHLDYQMVLGINHFSVHGLSYSLDGPRKDEVPPSLFYQHTQWKHMDVLWEHVSRTAAALTWGSHHCELAVLYPSTSLACRIQSTRAWHDLPDEAVVHEVVETLLSRHRDFDFIDETTLQEAVGDTGALGTPEPYRVILLPALRYVEAQTAAALLRFVRGGGRVIALGRLPEALTDDLESPLHRWGENEVEVEPSLTRELLDTLPGVAVEGNGASDVFVLQREKDGALRTFAFNRSDSRFHGAVEGRPVVLPPHGSVLMTPDRIDPPPFPRLNDDRVFNLSTDWRVTFEPNHLPLSFWHVSSPSAGPVTGFRNGPAFDLLRRESDPSGSGEDPRRYDCRFTLVGSIPDARLVIEDSAFTGDWRLYVNGHPVVDWRRVRVYDCLNQEADIASALRFGTTPALNVVTIVTSGPGRGVHEVPYLYGDFICEYRYGHLSFPFVRAASREHDLATLVPWDALGHPTFSGSAVYAKTFRLAERGDYLLDLGRVEDCAAVTVDGHPVAVLPWPPYRCMLPPLAEGSHELRVEITNPPANRNRAAGLVAGLLGPVTIAKVT